MPISNLENIFRRVAKDENLSRGEFKDFLVKSADMGGWLGGRAAKKAARLFVDKFDANRSGQVTFPEVIGKANKIINGLKPPADTRTVRAITEPLATKLDSNRDGRLQKAELVEAIADETPFYLDWLAPRAANVALDLLDTNRDGGLATDELLAPAAAFDEVVDALDTNDDGKLDSEEIGSGAAALDAVSAQ